jgi:hypothetical protein
MAVSENRCWWLFSDAPVGKGNEPEWLVEKDRSARFGGGAEESV